MPARYVKIGIRLHEELIAQLNTASRRPPFQLQRAEVMRAALACGLDIVEKDPSVRPPSHRDGKGKATAVPLDAATIARVDALASRLSPGFRIGRSEIVRGCIALGLADLARRT